MSIYNYILSWFSSGYETQYRIPPAPPQPCFSKKKENNTNKPKLRMIVKKQIVFDKDEIINSLNKLKKTDKNKLYVKKVYTPSSGVMGELHEKIKRID